MSKETIPTLKTKLRALGAKLCGNKAELQERLRLWTENCLDRTLFEVVVPRGDISKFPNLNSTQPLEKLKTDIIQWLSPKPIDLYFSERQAQKGNSQGRRLFMCDFLKNCLFQKDEHNIYFTAMCSAEMRRTVDYNVKVHINYRQCEIMKAECECPAGIGPNAACKHVSALLYGIEHYAVTGNVKQNPTCTSLLQQWHKPSNSAGRNLTRTSINEMLNIDTPNIDVCDVVTAFFYDAFSKAKCDSSLVRKKYCNVTAYFNDHDYCKDNIATIMLNELNAVTTAQIRKFEKNTRKNSKLWFQLRKTRITASIAHDVVRTCRTKRYATAFIKQHFLNKPIRSNALKWGIINEATALKKYCSVINDDFYKCGTIIDKERNYLAASPDAVNRTHDTIVEIKCPYSVRHGKPETVQYLQGGSLKATHKYYTQMQIQMHVTGIHRCDFVVWTPQGIFIQAVEYDEELVSTYLKEIEFYYRNVFAPLYFETIKQ